MPMGEPEYVTMDMVKTLLQNQADTFNSSFKLFIQDLKEDMKSIQKEITDMQVSLQFSQAKMEANKRRYNSWNTVSPYTVRILIKSSGGN